MLEGGAFQELHHDVGLALLLTDIVNGADVGMVQGRGGLSFPLETSQGLRIARHLIWEELQGDEAVQAGVFGLIDDAHPPAPELPDNFVVRDRLADHGVGQS